MAETFSESLRRRQLSHESRGATKQTETEDSDNRDFTNTGPFEQCKASSENPNSRDELIDIQDNEQKNGNINGMDSSGKRRIR